MTFRPRQIKASFWAVDLLLTTIIVFFLFKAGQHILAAPSAPPEPLSDNSGAKAPAASRMKIQSYQEYASLGKSNLFGALASSQGVVPPKIEETLPETTLELELLGCVASEEPALSSAIIRDKKTRAEGTYAPGDFIVSDAKLEAIRECEVVISRSGRREVLTMSFKGESPFVASSPFSGGRSAPFPSPTRTSATSQEAIRVVNDNLRYINRQRLMQEARSNIGQLLNQVNTSPNTVDGNPAGMRIDALGSDPLIDQSGIQAGDVIKSVNGIRVNSTEDIIGVSDRLENSPEIRVVVERDGRHRTLVYKVR